MSPTPRYSEAAVSDAALTFPTSQTKLSVMCGYAMVATAEDCRLCALGLPWPGPGFGQGSGTEVPPCEGQAQLEAGAAAQGIGSLGAREGGGSCCMMEFIRRQ